MKKTKLAHEWKLIHRYRGPRNDTVNRCSICGLYMFISNHDGARKPWRSVTYSTGRWKPDLTENPGCTPSLVHLAKRSEERV